jgi:hypothetical protein
LNSKPGLSEQENRMPEALPPYSKVVMWIKKNGNTQYVNTMARNFFADTGHQLPKIAKPAENSYETDEILAELFIEKTTHRKVVGR